jgi:hypothetical protein
MRSIEILPDVFRIQSCQTEASRRPIPLHPLVLNALLEWRAKAPYSTALDFWLPSVRFKGNTPLSPNGILEKSVVRSYPMQYKSLSANPTNSDNAHHP